jgi:hypothetical protein
VSLANWFDRQRQSEIARSFLAGLTSGRKQIFGMEHTASCSQEIETLRALIRTAWNLCGKDAYQCCSKGRDYLVNHLAGLSTGKLASVFPDFTSTIVMESISIAGLTTTLVPLPEISLSCFPSSFA